VIATNVSRILEAISPGDIVLDIGGWACPFNRANYVLDAQPYDTRGFYSTFGGPRFQGGEVECFSRATWIQRDICDRTPFPFTDKSVDYVICSHTLEDVRDPLWVCSEMIRIGKRGYLEVPSRVAESSRGWEHPRLAGLSHHRWLVEIKGQHVVFQMKSHHIHSHWRYSFPRAHLASLTAEQRVQWLFWQESFEYSERMFEDLAGVRADLESFVAGVRPYPKWRLGADSKFRTVADICRQASSGVLRRLQALVHPGPGRIPEGRARGIQAGEDE
jgi:hypothetical protein